jgi:acetyltransferase-like isoleucine patch superfamily enzyme
MKGDNLTPTIEMKWAIWNEMRRVLILPMARIHFLINGVVWNNKWRIFGLPIIQRYSGSRISIGDRIIIRSWVSSNPVAPYHPVFFSTRSKNAEITIGNDFGITGGSIIAMEKVEIGNRVLVGGNCLITDTDFHPLDMDTRIMQPHHAPGRPVSIADDVFIGAQSIILKGSTIGRASVIGAGSVVSGEIPPNVVAAGNPAVVLRRLTE